MAELLNMGEAEARTRTALALERLADALQAQAAVHTHGRAFDLQGRLIYTAVDVEAARGAIEAVLRSHHDPGHTVIVHAVLKAVGGAFEEAE